MFLVKLDDIFWVNQVVDRTQKIPQESELWWQEKVLSKEKPNSILVHFFDNWDQVSNNFTGYI
jgi:hypothetical protein